MYDAFALSFCMSFIPLSFLPFFYSTSSHIARNLYEMSALKVPVLCILIGEGGSGGALAMAVGNEVWMLENAVYSILSPEGYASILWKDSNRAEEAAEVMQLTAQDLSRLGVIEKVIPEYGGADKESVPYIGKFIKMNAKEFLKKFDGMSGEEIRKYIRDIPEYIKQYTDCTAKRNREEFTF